MTPTPPARSAAIRSRAAGRSIVAATPLLLVATSIASPEEPCPISLDTYLVAVPAEGATREVEISLSGDCWISYYADASWISIEETSAGNDVRTVSLVVEPNSTGLPRQGFVTFAVDDAPSHRLRVAQRRDTAGPVVGWGRDDHGQATPPADLGGVLAVAAGTGTSAALLPGGGVRRWGRFDTVPEGLGDVVDLTWSLALRSDGSVVSLDGDAVPWGLSGVAAIASGPGHHAALRSDGTVACWGDGSSGQCDVPPGLPPVVLIAAGGSHTAAITTFGDVVAWGNGGRLGEAPEPEFNMVPIDVAAGDGITSIRFPNGVIRTWSASGPEATPTLPVPPGAWRMDSWGDAVIAVNGVVYETGDPSDAPPVGLPIVDAAIGDGHGLAVVGDAGCRLLPSARSSAWIGDDGGAIEFEAASSGTSCTWSAHSDTDWLAIVEAPRPGSTARMVVEAAPNHGGAPRIGRTTLGDLRFTVVQGTLGPERLVVLGGFGSPSGETPPRFDQPVVEIAAGSNHHLVRLADGTIHGWGNGGSGQISPPPGLETVVAIAAGQYHSAALLESGEVVCWGSNQLGQIDVPPDLGPAVQIGAGAYATFARLADGSVRGWGLEPFSSVPPDVGNVVDLDVGHAHVVALLADGTVRCWGFNDFGQCDPPSGLDGVAAVAAGLRHSVAIRLDGSVVGWGYGPTGECSAWQEVASPIAIDAAGELTSHISDGFTVVQNEDGRLAAWGAGFWGQTAIPDDLGRVDQFEAWNRATLVLRSDCDGNGIADGYEIRVAPSRDLDGNGRLDCCDAETDCNGCRGDLDGNGIVGGSDITLLLEGWGPTGKASVADLDGNGIVNGSDLLILLADWGVCP